MLLFLDMASTGLRVHDRLDGVSNFSVWKVKISLALEENGIKDYVTIVVDVCTKET